MPDISTPAPLEYTGGLLRTNRLVPARLNYSGGTITTARDTPTTAPVDIPSLNRLTRWDKFPGVDDEAWQRFMAIWQEKCEAIEAAFVAVNARVDEVALLARLSAVEALASTANDNATIAQATASQVSEAVQQTFTEVDPVYGDRYGELLQE